MALVGPLAAAQIRGVLAAEARCDERLAAQQTWQLAVAVGGQAVLVAGMAAHRAPPEAAEVAAGQVIDLAGLERPRRVGQRRAVRCPPRRVHVGLIGA
jgi:hypothetical protein